MACYPFKDEQGLAIGIVCTRGPRYRDRKCATCAATRSSLECDGCDHVLCTACAVSPRQGLDFCPTCFKPAWAHWLREQLAAGTTPATTAERRQAFRFWARANPDVFLKFSKQRTAASLRDVPQSEQTQTGGNVTTKLVKQLERCAEATRKRCFGPGDSVHVIFAESNAKLDLLCTLDAPRLLGLEIERLRRLLRKHGGRP